MNRIPLWCALFGITAALSAGCDKESDIVIWGSTVCGVTSAVGAKRTNKDLSVIWAVNDTRLGGMSSGGLGGIDKSMQIGGLAGDLMNPFGKAVEPHTMENAVINMTESAPGEPIIIVRKAVGLASVQTENKKIVSMTTMSGLVICGTVFIDCSYEGDLLRLSGTSYSVGREPKSKYEETMAGTDHYPFAGEDEKPSFFDSGVSPFTDSTNTTLLPFVNKFVDFKNDTDDNVMSYCFRMCLSKNASTQIPITKPSGYDRTKLELLRRELASQASMGHNLTMQDLFLIRYLPNDKMDLNSGQWSATGHPGGYFPFSTDLPNFQSEWPEGDFDTRQRIFAEHKFWTHSMLYFLSYDEEIQRIQPTLTADMSQWGLCGDEYETPDHWTPQLYVRESIRLNGKRIFTERETFGTPHGKAEPTSVGLSRWAVDIHAVQRVAANINGVWTVVNAGGHDSGRISTEPGTGQLTEIPYEVFVPAEDDTINLLVPVCASFSHIAFATYRLEPQYAVFGHSCGVAAALAAADSGMVRDVDVDQLRGILAAWTPTPQILSSNSSADVVGISLLNSVESPTKWKLVNNSHLQPVANSSMCVTSAGRSAPIPLKSCVAGNSAQIFKIIDEGSNLMKIQTSSGLCLTALSWFLTELPCSSKFTDWTFSNGELTVTGPGGGSLCVMTP
eukprot:TRINITY_DN15626_c0_g1_i1.p1 TRINITY_DN15626_c0_g1~~TRINITY_DN15626_c0_g1_i1.p1  ORF type:complete len:673 (+),score=102.65 TRINITY_DN15626_c0_g1_i1:81-2099(+)